MGIYPKLRIEISFGYLNYKHKPPKRQVQRAIPASTAVLRIKMPGFLFLSPTVILDASQNVIVYVKVIGGSEKMCVSELLAVEKAGTTRPSR